MPDSLDDVTHDEFILFLPLGVFTETEIIEKIKSYSHPSAKERLDIVTAVAKLYGGGPVTGPMRTAIRSMEGLPPVAGD